MTTTLDPTTAPTTARTIPTLVVEQAPLESVTFDFYRNIHKGIRAELFGVTLAAANIDPARADAVGEVAARWHRLSGLLLEHAEHEDEHIQPTVERVLPALAAQIGPVHHELAAWAAALEVLADRAADACFGTRRLAVHRLHLGLAGFVSAYLAHQEFEELEVMPALSAVVPVDDLIAMEVAIVSSLTPEQTVYSLSLMLPAMNLEDRVELVGMMQAGMPAEAFPQMWALVSSVLSPIDTADLGSRLGIV